jgi:ABC-type dipeptide/oligopeptide/nickel transport system permease subunit
MSTDGSSTTPQAITGIQAMQGHGVKQSRGFWAEAWSQVIRRFSAIVGLTWLGIVTFFAVFAPLIASGHPIRFVQTDADGTRTVSYPLFNSLTAPDWLLLLATLGGAIFLLVPIGSLSKAKRLGWIIIAMVAGTVPVLMVTLLRSGAANDWLFGLLDFLRSFERDEQGNAVLAYAVVSIFISASVGVLLTLWIPFSDSVLKRLAWLVLAVTCSGAVLGLTWDNRPPLFNYNDAVRAGTADASYTLIPWSPAQRPTDRNTSTMAPGQSEDQALVRNVDNSLSNYLDNEKLSLIAPVGPTGFDIARDVITRQPLADSTKAELQTVLDRFEETQPDATRLQINAVLRESLADDGRTFPLGTDNQGVDMLSQMLHACRLSISIGLVSTGISLIIGVTVGALMGYFGGWVDLVLYRVVEIFMAIPVLFLLIVAAGVLPKNIYVMMIIIGCFSWTGAARFIRAEFLKLRNMDFVQSARATGLPLRSILFKHMLPNGVTPVLVESSFAIAAAILAEATLSYLGLGPDNQPSWGKLLASATGESGEFFWWLAIFPGAAIFLTVLSYNLIGEALRDAIDPKLKKARV